MAETDLAADYSSSEADESPPALDSQEAPSLPALAELPPRLAEVAPETDAAPVDLAREPSLTLWQQALRSVVIALALVVALALLAPIALALVAALWSLARDGMAIAGVAQLLSQGRLLDTAPAMNALSVASRISFVSIGYLGYFFALMALIAGLLGRGRGRLFIIPGALLTGSALVLLAASVALCWPLIVPLRLPLGALLGLALYALLDAVALATALADTRYTRRQWRRARRSARRSLRGSPPRDDWDPSEWPLPTG